MLNFEHSPVHLRTDFPIQWGTQALRRLLSIFNFPHTTQKTYGTAGRCTVRLSIFVDIDNSPLLNTCENLDWKPIHVPVLEMQYVDHSKISIPWRRCAVQCSNSKGPRSLRWCATQKRVTCFPWSCCATRAVKLDRDIGGLQALSLWGEDEGWSRESFSVYCLPYMGSREIKLHISHTNHIWECFLWIRLMLWWILVMLG